MHSFGRTSLVQAVDSVWVELVKLGGFVHSTTHNQRSVGITSLFVTRFYQLAPQASTQDVLRNNRLNPWVLPTMHRTNGKGNKENTL